MALMASFFISFHKEIFQQLLHMLYFLDKAYQEKSKQCLKGSVLLPILGFIFEILHTKLKYCYICGLGLSLLIPYEARVPKNY